MAMQTHTITPHTDVEQVWQGWSDRAFAAHYVPQVDGIPCHTCMANKCHATGGQHRWGLGAPAHSPCSQCYSGTVDGVPIGCQRFVPCRTCPGCDAIVDQVHADECTVVPVHNPEAHAEAKELIDDLNAMHLPYSTVRAIYAAFNERDEWRRRAAGLAAHAAALAALK